jgi:glycosyltransferase involved in cell wall biosynthesis
MRVAYFSPLPPQRSGIAAYSALLLPALRRRIDVAVARRRRPLLRKTDVALYHVGNDPRSHGWIVEALRRRPGVVVLHELVLHHLVAGMTLGRGNADGYLEAMEREGGRAGRLLAQDVIAGRVPPPWETRPEELPLAGEVLELAAGLIVHSRYLERWARELGYARPIWRIPMPAWPEVEADPAPIDGAPLIGSFGHLNAAKRIPQLLDAFARLRRSHPSARLLLVGPASSGLELRRRIDRLQLGEEVVWQDYVPEPRLWSLLRACDVFVALRAPTMGETSASAVRALSAGLPLVVSDVGWFSELPDEVALRIPVDRHEVDALVTALDLLASSEERRTAMSAAGLEYVRREHDLERSAELYTVALERAAGGEAVTDGLLAEIAQAAADVGIEADSPELVGIADRLRETDLV